jgi:polysaccharide pyruvyl transferase WcaK-like protein
MQPKIIVAIQDNSNFGDDLLYLSGLRLLNLHFLDRRPRFYVQSKRLSELAHHASQRIEYIPQVEYIDKVKINEAGNEYLNVHLGGTIFSSKYRLKAKVSYFCRDLLYKDEIFVPSIYISLGVDRRPARRKFTVSSLKQSKYISVRDYSSFVAISENVSRYDAFVIPDSVFTFPIRDLLPRVHSDISLKNVNIIRHWPFGKIDRSEGYYRIGEGGVCVGFCHTDKGNYEMMNVYEGTFDGMIRLIGMLSRAQCLVSERYHGVIAGTMLGIPVIGNCIDTKIRSLADELGAVELSDDHYLFLPGRTPDASKVQQSYLNFFKLAEL